MGFWEHRAVQDKCDLAALKDGSIRDCETPPEEMDRRRLSPRQMTALKAFHSGSSLKDATKAAGVTRQTLHRWRTQYHSFAEAMEVWEEGQMVIARSRLVDMADNAIDALANAIEDGNVGAAILVLKSLRILRTYGPVKAPAEKMSAPAVLPALNNSPLEEPACGAGFQPAVNERVEQRVVSERVEQPGICGQQGVKQEQAGRPHHNGNGAPAREAATLVAGDRRPRLGGDHFRHRGVAGATHSMVAKTAVPAQHGDVISNSLTDRPKTVKLAGKAGSAIQNACYSALQEVTGSDEMLHAGHG